MSQVCCQLLDGTCHKFAAIGGTPVSSSVPIGGTPGHKDKVVALLTRTVTEPPIPLIGGTPFPIDHALDQLVEPAPT